jgi:hypothetical protein
MKAGDTRRVAARFLFVALAFQLFSTGSSYRYLREGPALFTATFGLLYGAFSGGFRCNFRANKKSPICINGL